MLGCRNWEVGGRGSGGGGGQRQIGAWEGPQEGYLKSGKRGNRN